MRRLTCLTVAVAAFLVAPAAASAATLPAVVGSVANSSSLSGADAVAVSGTVAYVAAYWTGQLTAVDISNPSDPRILGSTPPTTSLENGTAVAIAGHYAFVTSKNRNASASSNDDGSGNSLTVVDISNPSSPTVVGSVNNTQFPNELFGPYHVAVAGNYAYVAYQGDLEGQPQSPDTSFGGFSVINLSTLQVVGNIDNSSLHNQYNNALNHATSVAIEGNTAYVTAFYNQALTAIDISNPTAPQVIGTLSHATFGGAAALPWPNDVQVAGNYAYVASQGSSTQDQLAVVNIANPGSMSVVGTLSNPILSNAYTIRLSGSVAYIAAANSAGTVAEIDVSNPASPQLTGSVQDSAHLNSVTGLSVDSTGDYLVAASPRLSTDPKLIYPPFTDTTGTVSVIQVGIPSHTTNTSAPSNTTAPSVSGRAVQHGRLAGTLGTWTGNPGLSARWLRCNSRGGACRPIKGANGSSYTLTAADIGSTIRFSVQASNSAGSATAQSAATAVVKANPAASLSGVGQRRATLHLTVSAPDAGSSVTKIVVSLPRGMRFARSKRQLAGGIRITAPTGKRIAFKASIHDGSLVLALRRAVSTANVTIQPFAMSVSSALASNVRDGRTRKLTVTVAFSGTGAVTGRNALALRVR